MEIKKEIEKAIQEIQYFTGFQVEGEADSIEYLHTARRLANAYDELLEIYDDEEKVHEKVHYIRHILKDNPSYLDFHRESD